MLIKVVRIEYDAYQFTYNVVVIEYGNKYIVGRYRSLREAESVAYNYSRV